MTLHGWIGFLALVLVVGAFVWTFRTGAKIKPESGKDPMGGLPPGGTTGL